MKKTVWLITTFVIGVVSTLFLIRMEKCTALLTIDENDGLVICLNVKQSEKTIQPWQNKRDNIYYFFLPSVVSDNKIYVDNLDADIVIDGEILSKQKGFPWEQEKIYEVSYKEQQYKCVFMKSSNIPVLFMETESGTMEHLNADKDVFETGIISIVNETGNWEIQQDAKKISARGNTTFEHVEKKAYSFTLNKSYPLCGMDAGKKWNLLAMYFEYDKIHTKLVYDMVNAFDMEFGIDGTWVDLYCNGEYQGLYLLTEAVTVGNGRVDIYDMGTAAEDGADVKGGFLIEKDVQERLDEYEKVFITDQCDYCFTIKSPKYATDEQIKDIKAYIQNIENLLITKDKRYKDYVDLESFAQQFLIDKLVLEPDAMRMSSFFYKDANSDVLKAGPLWDYDRAFGTAVSNYELSIGDYPDGMHGWYMKLYEEEEFKEILLDSYRKLLPLLSEMLHGGIDEYVNYISDAVEMDRVRWPLEYYQTNMMSYMEYDSYIKYLKFFLAKRLNYLNDVWEISDWEFEIPSPEGEHHIVSFVWENGEIADTREVMDGTVINDLPYLDEEKYQGWGIDQKAKLYNSYIPIYEDMVLSPRRIFNDLSEIAEYKLELLNYATDIVSYMKTLSCEELSVCIFIDGNTSLIKRDEIIRGIKEICLYHYPDWLDNELNEGKNYFLLIDRGSEEILDSINTDIQGINTTFGSVSYGDGSDEKYLYIQENGINYLDEETVGGITFVVINRYTGEISDTVSFY